MSDILSVEIQRAFVRDIAGHRKEVDVEVPDAGDDWDMEWMTSADGIAKFGVRGKMKEIHRICKDGGKAAPVSVFEVINPS